MKKPFLALLLGAAALAGCNGEKPTHDHVSFTTHAEKEVANDVVMADVSIIRHGADVPAMTKQANTDTAWAMALAKQAAGIESKTTSFNTSSNGSGDSATPPTWDVTQYIHLESQDTQAMSDLLGKLQAKAQIGSISYGISEGAKKAAKSELTANAMTEFREQAGKVAADMGYKQYEVVKLDIHSPDDEMPMPLMPHVKARGDYNGSLPAEPKFQDGNPVLEGGKEKLSISIQAEIGLSGK